MRSKNILSVVAFIAAFGFSAAFASLFITKTPIKSTEFVLSSNSTKTSCFYRKNLAIANKINTFVDADHQNGIESDRALYSYGQEVYQWSNDGAISDYAGAVEKYVDDSSSMNTSSLPQDFQVEWREHMKAWRDYSNFLNRMKKSSNRAGLNADEINAVDAAHSREITITWKDVIQVSANYGANIY